MGESVRDFATLVLHFGTMYYYAKTVKYKRESAITVLVISLHIAFEA